MDLVRCRALLGVLCLLASAAPARAVVLYANDAEGGLSGIVDETSGSYPLIQSAVAGQGTLAFHLAHPLASSEWFEIDQTITPQADTKLFFLSRLGSAQSDQVARVQVSTNGGASWPTTLYTQAGAGQPGESAFSLKEIDLSPYANQDLRFRFFYEFDFGSYFPQSSAGVGWYVDDIQIADQLQKTQYSIGDPSDYAQQYLEYINRARADALVEANRLANATDPDITSAYNFFGVTPANIINQFTVSAADGTIDQFAQPLSFNAKLIQAAELHTQDMFDNDFQGHVSVDPPAPLLPGDTLGDRLDAVGYNGGAGENVFSFADSVAQGHAGFDVDWGNGSNPGANGYHASFAGQGMQNPAGHRMSIHNNDFKEIGIGVINGSNGDVGPQLVTQDFGDPGDVTFVTGVVFEDLNANSFYDIGEGRSGVRIDVEGSPFFAVSSSSGGYSVPVSGDGEYDVDFSGGGFAPFSALATTTGGLNVKIDYLATAAAEFAADFTGDGVVNGDDLAQWRGDFGVNAQSDADGDGDSDGADFLVWQRQVGLGNTPAGAAVPEPASWMMIALAAAAFAVRRRHQA